MTEGKRITETVKTKSDSRNILDQERGRERENDESGRVEERDGGKRKIERAMELVRQALCGCCSFSLPSI